jgi:hypothetical protein
MYHNEWGKKSVVNGDNDVLVEVLDDRNDFLQIGDSQERIGTNLQPDL